MSTTLSRKPHRPADAGRPPPAVRGRREAARPRYHHGDLPAALKRAAVMLIARHGVEGFSLREAAVAVGVSPSAAYRHFADKSALLREIARDAFAEMGQRFAAAMARVTGGGARAARARFLAQGEAYVAFALEQPERFQVMFGPHGAAACQSVGGGCEAGAAGDAGMTGEPPVPGPGTALGHALDELLAAGVIDPARRAGAELLAWSSIHGLATLLVCGAFAGQPGDVPRMVQRIAEDCLRALAPPR
jgi:AcrR family transcriptional regulator